MTTSSRAGANGAARFHVTYPNDWKSVAVTQVAPQSGGLAALEQRAGLGLIIFRRTGSASHLDGAFVRNLDRELRRTTADYKPVGIKIIKVSGEKALLFTYLRTKKNELHNIVVVPAGDHSFTIATASSAASPKIAKEVGEIIHSFKLL
ncbi:MAG: hypothetical protein JOY72_07175 [Actinobacteria bacterium]|nr:hypothetical protein [Actinomycetota bacterium]